MSAESLAGYDAVVLNNTCPTAPRRDMFQDYVEDAAKAEALKDSVIDFVARGGGLVPLHGGSLACMNCEKWEAMQGATFDHHPHHQWVTLTPTEPDHPLLGAFGGEAFTHFDEPYLFENKYTAREIRPLLVMDPEGMNWLEDRPTPVGPCPVAWIKRHGEGRVFYCSPSHYAQSFDDQRLLLFILDGIQYALGDLQCDDTSPAP
jgi:type 1 glutamine amidotransferase